MQTVEDLWTGSVRRYRERERAEHRWLWIRHYDRMARLHGDLAASYEARAAALIEDPHGAPAREEPDATLTNPAERTTDEGGVEGSYEL